MTANNAAVPADGNVAVFVPAEKRAEEKRRRVKSTMDPKDETWYSKQHEKAGKKLMGSSTVQKGHSRKGHEEFARKRNLDINIMRDFLKRNTT